MKIVSCNELHIGNTPRSVMTKGTSTRRNNRLLGSLYGNFDPGNNDKLMISYRRATSHDNTMMDACGVLFEGEIHFLVVLIIVLTIKLMMVSHHW